MKNQSQKQIKQKMLRLNDVVVLVVVLMAGLAIGYHTGYWNHDTAFDTEKAKEVIYDYVHLNNINTYVLRFVSENSTIKHIQTFYDSVPLVEVIMLEELRGICRRSENGSKI